MLLDKSIDSICEESCLTRLESATLSKDLNLATGFLSKIPARLQVVQTIKQDRFRFSNVPQLDSLSPYLHKLKEHISVIPSNGVVV